MINSSSEGKKYFYKKQYKEALEKFIEEKNDYASGVCCLLLKREKEAENYFKKDVKNSRASEWGLIVLDLINLKTPRKTPAFFQTRAYLEIYLNLFLENDLIEWAQNMISSCDVLYKSNPEVYKFMARALFSNGYIDIAITFCKKTLRLFYSDPEAFLILSQCYYLKNDLGEALDCINKVMAMVDDYYPAKIFKRILKKDIEELHKKEQY